MQSESPKMCFEIEVDCISLTSSTTKTTTKTTLKDDPAPSPLGPRLAQPPLKSSTSASSPRPSAMKRTPSASPRTPIRSVSFAVDENDKPLPTASDKHHHSSRSRSRSRSPSRHSRHRVKIGEDFTLYPSPSPSPPMSPILRASTEEEARMVARQRELEDEIAELTRRALARESLSREDMRQRLADVDALLRDRANRSPTFENIAFKEKTVSRRRSKDGSVDLSSPTSETPNSRLNADFKHEHVTFLPSPLPSPGSSHTRTTTFESRSRSHPQQNNPASVPRTRTPPITPQKFSDLRPFTLADLERIRSRIRDRPVQEEREPGPSDSITCVVGEFNDEEMRDAESSLEELSRGQCQRCGLFGHELADCRTPALTTPLRRKRARESDKDKEAREGPPMKGVRHVRWLGFGGAR